MNVSTKEIIYLALALLGLCGTWYYNIQFFQTAEDPSLSNFIDLAATTLPAKSINMDLLVCVLTFFAWYIPEALRLKMRFWWVFILLTFSVAIAFSFPLFLFFRERKIRLTNSGSKCKMHT